MAAFTSSMRALIWAFSSTPSAIASVIASRSSDIACSLARPAFSQNYAKVVTSGMLTVGALGGAVSPYVSGSLHDAFGNYNPMLMVLMALMMVEPQC